MDQGFQWPLPSLSLCPASGNHHCALNSFYTSKDFQIVHGTEIISYFCFCIWTPSFNITVSMPILSQIMKFLTFMSKWYFTLHGLYFLLPFVSQQVSCRAHPLASVNVNKMNMSVRVLLIHWLCFLWIYIHVPVALLGFMIGVCVIVCVCVAYILFHMVD